MTNFIPVFPLGLVVYPGEHLNLHIFEPRYKQLITECHESGKSFGIPAVIDNKLQEHGTLVKVTEISKVYPDGEMDIRTQGQDVFRILEVIREIPDKLYSGAIVNYPPNNNRMLPGVLEQLMQSIRELHELLQVKKEMTVPGREPDAYALAHHVGMSLQEEYELLCLFDERQRQEYLKRFLEKVLPTVAGMEQLKEKIRLNGHFKSLPGLKWEE
ncbi:LON peptidase substrate-binding domain-containing protein [Nostoc ellipsosporum NOK]|nr:LON peptidase substrate-binding domain-containing protein [Nostoc ellipsosporum NOK]